MLSHYFSETYEEARQRFREAAAAVGAELLSYPINLAPRDDLSIDVAILGDRS